MLTREVKRDCISKDHVRFSQDGRFCSEVFIW